MGKGAGGTCRPMLDMNAAQPAGTAPRARRRLSRPVEVPVRRSLVPSSQDAERMFEELIAQVDRFHADPQAWQAYKDSYKPMTAYPAASVDEVLEQRPTATRVAGKRAWAARGRRVKDGAQPLTITTKPPVMEVYNPSTGEPIAAELQPFLGENPKKRLPALIRAQIGAEDWRVLQSLPSREVQPAKTQEVFDIADTEPVEPAAWTAEQRQAARETIDMIAELCEQRGIIVTRGNAPHPDTHDRTVRAAHRALVSGRDVGGLSSTVRWREPREETRYIALPGGVDEVEELRLFAHEFAHQAFGHNDHVLPSSFQRMLRQERELQAEAFAYLVCRNAGVHSDETVPYLVMYGRANSRHPGRMVARQRDKVLGKAEDLRVS